MINFAARKYLGVSGWQGQTGVYLLADCIEIEARGMAVEIERRRVYLDDVALVTRSRRVNYFLIVPCILAAMSFGLLTAAFLALTLTLPRSANSTDPMVLLAAMALFLIFAVLIAAHVIRKEEIITVFGRRKKIEIRFGLFKRKRCEAAYAAIVSAARAAMEQTRAAIERDRPTRMEPAALAVEFFAPPVVPVLEAVARIEPVIESPPVAVAPPVSLPPPPMQTARLPDLPLMPEIRLTPKEPAQ